MSLKPSPELRPSPWDALVILLIAALALGTLGLTWLNGGASGQVTAVISVDGEEIDRAPLGAKETRVYQAGGYALTVSFSPDGVQVLSSDCPTQDCVHTGTIRRGGQSIICLPARFVLVLEGDSGPDAVDAVLG